MPSDPRAQQAREHHREVAVATAAAARHREARDSLVRALRQSDPILWTYGKLSRAIGCSPELIAAIVQGRTKT